MGHYALFHISRLNTEPRNAVINVIWELNELKYTYICNQKYYNYLLKYFCYLSSNKSVYYIDK